MLPGYRCARPIVGILFYASIFLRRGSDPAGRSLAGGRPLSTCRLPSAERLRSHPFDTGEVQSADGLPLAARFLNGERGVPNFLDGQCRRTGSDALKNPTRTPTAALPVLRLLASVRPSGHESTSGPAAGHSPWEAGTGRRRGHASASREFHIGRLLPRPA